MKSRTTLASRRKYKLNNPEKVRESNAKYRAANKDKIAARSAVNYQIRAGYWIRPNNCNICLLGKRVEAHHHDYTKKLEVTWLCKDCHESQ